MPEHHDDLDRAAAVRPDEQMDWPVLERYLRNHLPSTEESMTTAQFHGGHANLTYLLRFGETEYVLRRPPFGKIAPGAHDMKREFRVLSKLSEHFSPAPRAYHYCADESIIGAPFVVVERRHGVLVRYDLPDCFKKFDRAEERLTTALVKMQAELHRLDPYAIGLEKLGRPEGFLERQLAGWSHRWQLAQTEENDKARRIEELLAGNIPVPQAVSIVHNDIKFDNCQFQPDDPDRVTSLFDWDMTTLGDPLSCFASTLGYWPDGRFPEFKFPVMLRGNFPDKEFVREQYARFTGYDLSRITWYEAFAYFKAAVICQQLYQRFHQGKTTDRRMAGMGRAAEMFLEIAFRLLNG